MVCLEKIRLIEEYSVAASAVFFAVSQLRVKTRNSRMHFDYQKRRVPWPLKRGSPSAGLIVGVLCGMLIWAVGFLALRLIVRLVGGN